MSRIDLHVDELFDRARAGTIDAGERARLLAHCEACVGCRAELAWLHDGLHASAPSRADRALATDAMEALFGRDTRHESTPAPTRKAARIGQSAAIACAALLLASAAAALYTGVQAWREREDGAERDARDASDARRAVKPPRAMRREAVLRTDSIAAAVQPSAGAASATYSGQPAVAAAAAAPARMPAAVSAQPSVQADARSPARSSALPAAPRVPTTTTTTTAGTTREQQAEALFARANARRATGSYERALSSYAQLTLAFPETRSGLAAHISRADLLLRRVGRPQAALAGYRAYLAARSVGGLAEEARVGVAISLQRLGRQDEERTAWLELLEHHPGSLHGARARARLHALSR